MPPFSPNKTLSLLYLIMLSYPKLCIKFPQFAKMDSQVPNYSSRSGNHHALCWVLWHNGAGRSSRSFVLPLPLLFPQRCDTTTMVMTILLGWSDVAFSFQPMSGWTMGWVDSTVLVSVYKHICIVEYGLLPPLWDEQVCVKGRGNTNLTFLGFT